MAFRTRAGADRKTFFVLKVVDFLLAAVEVRRQRAGDVHDSLKVWADCGTHRIVCLTPPVDNVSVSAEWVGKWRQDGIGRRGTGSRGVG
jgi:hypothetical protein